MTDLSAQQFGRLFHGTTHAVKGGAVLPADSAGKNVAEASFGDPGDMSEGDHAFAIRGDESYAWHAANTFHPSLRRSRVYEVEPAADQKPGPWNKEHPDFAAHHEFDSMDDLKQHAPELLKDGHQDEWASKTGFPVKQRLDTMPGRQGTFPDISWGRFSNKPYSQAMNHPTDPQATYGHESHGELRKVQNAALYDNAKIDAADPRAPKLRGSRLKDFMMGNDKAVPDPHHGQGTLF